MFRSMEELNGDGEDIVDCAWVPCLLIEERDDGYLINNGRGALDEVFVPQDVIGMVRGAAEPIPSGSEIEIEIEVGWLIKNSMEIWIPNFYGDEADEADNYDPWADAIDGDI